MNLHSRDMLDRNLLRYYHIMSEIPGYYWDPEKRRHFKILPSYSNIQGAITQTHIKLEQRLQKQNEFMNNTKQNDKEAFVTGQKKRRRQRSLSNNTRKKSKEELAKIIKPKSNVRLLREREYGLSTITNIYRTKKNGQISDRDLKPIFSYINTQDTDKYHVQLANDGYCIQVTSNHISLQELNNSLFHVCYYSQYKLPIQSEQSSFYIDKPAGTSVIMSTTHTSYNLNTVTAQFIELPVINQDDIMQSNQGYELCRMNCDKQDIDPKYYRKLSRTLRLAHYDEEEIDNFELSYIPASNALGPCCYSNSFAHFTFNVNNQLSIYDMNTFKSVICKDLNIKRVCLCDTKFSTENSQLLYLTDGHRLQMYDLRGNDVRKFSNEKCSMIKCLKRNTNYLLTSYWNETVSLNDIRMRKSIFNYETNAISFSDLNPNFTFTIDDETENYVSACSQYHIAYIWDLNDGSLINQFQCPLPKRKIYMQTKSTIACVKEMPVMIVYHPEYTKLVTSQGGLRD
ncbi:unnamed protein product [Didymodactylos carnosus]|uniref:Uncharacterized protein n=1 Tax=Didymodactylos carnosus TaxID=1234261 RepID=A0A814KFL9_9BILA|nr:unnamed protein product [Didymodactylos carnosus]CAF3820684.1 unnamed protein product [Didymodactylos carnosus]